MYSYSPGDLQSYASSPSHRMHRGALVLLLCALLGVTGAITFTAYASNTVTTPIPVRQPIVAPVPTARKQPVLHAKADSTNKATKAATRTTQPTHTTKATFFDVGYLVQDYPAIARAEYDQGHIVADHSWSHPDLTRMSYDGIYSQLSAAAQAIHSAIGVYPTFFRPPYGNYNTAVIQQAMSLNLNTVMWNDDPRDWSLPGTSMIIDRALGEARNGSIILLHDGGGNRWQTVAALPTIITTLRARGYQLVTVQQLLQDMSAPAHAQLALSGRTFQGAAVRSRHPQFHLPPPPPHWSLPARLALAQ